METLNDILQRHLQGNRRTFASKGMTIVIDLDKNMPAIYPDETIGTLLNGAMAQLTLELEDSNPSKAKYQTKYENETQILMIFHNGRPVPESTLENLNSSLRDIAEGRLKWMVMRHGNLIAGQRLKEYGGRVYLENLTKDEYTVKTTAEIPVKSSALTIN